MATDVVMPQMGESIAEGTIVRWIKKVGEKVDRDEPLFEISTDKVDAEIPSPAAGVVSEIRVKEGETVPVNSVVAVIGSTSAVASPPASVDKSVAEVKAAAEPKTPPAPAAKAVEPPKPSPQADGSSASTAPESSAAAPRQASVPASQTPTTGVAPEDKRGPKAAQSAPPVAHAPLSTEDALHQRSSPLVRKIAKEHNIDISQIHGTGIAGRVTKDDILAFIGGSGSAAPRTLAASAGPAFAAAVAPARAASAAATGGPASAGQAAPGDRVEKMSPMRKRISEHMVASRRTSAHVHSVFEVNFSRVAQIREAKKAEFERGGAKLTFLSFIVKAAVEALRAVPIVNASVDGDSVVYHKDINVGIAVALDWGLIVPVIKNADERNLVGLSRSIADLANRARQKQLKPEDVQGGTFTITNPGVFGALFGMPIINQPQVAILGVGNIEKRPVVVDDAIAIRPMAYLSLGYDHRVIDGAVADEFMSHVKKTIENWDPAAI
jgi:pyruvate dehydrogenase E2 component (dihydrolipoyllysine-residue acetyltransferase)